MPIARLSGRVEGSLDPRRKDRAELLYHLFYNGWDIYNGNGDQTIEIFAAFFVIVNFIKQYCG